MRLNRLLMAMSVGVALPFAAAAQQGNGVVRAFEPLASHPDCQGQGETAWRAVFDLPEVAIRFGWQGEGKAQACSIRTRRGAEIKEVSIPCPVDPAKQPVRGEPPEDLPRHAALSGQVEFCTASRDVRVVGGKWSLRAQTTAGALALDGGWSDTGMSVVYSGPQVWAAAGEQPRIAAAMIGLAFDEIPTGLEIGEDGALSVTTYLALLGSDNVQAYCESTYCPAGVPNFGRLVRNIARDGNPFYSVVTFVEDR